MAEVKKTTTRKTTTQKRHPHSGFNAPMIGVIDNTPVKYLPNGDINPAWKKQQNKKK